MSAASVERPWAGQALHFVGIGGAGMSGLALIAQNAGRERHRLRPGHLAVHGAAARGRDRTDHRARRSQRSRRRRGRVLERVGPENPERAAGLAAGRSLHRSELLAQIAKLKRCLAVSGAAGKTTTSAMIVHVLRGCGLDPAYAVGGELRSTGLNADWGAGEWIVIEADESDRSLLNYAPEIAVLTNCELDHHATYSSRLDLERTFAEFTGSRADRGGLGSSRAARARRRRGRGRALRRAAARS